MGYKRYLIIYRVQIWYKSSIYAITILPKNNNIIKLNNSIDSQIKYNKLNNSNIPLGLAA